MNRDRLVRLTRATRAAQLRRSRRLKACINRGFGAAASLHAEADLLVGNIIRATIREERKRRIS